MKKVPSTKSIIASFLAITLLFTLQSFIITRHDVKDEAFITLGKEYSDVLCHFPMGEGTLINPTWIVTAGHVAQDIDKDLTSGKVSYVKINGQDYEIQAVFVHPEFKPIINDIGLIQLKTPVTSGRYAQLYTSNNEKGLTITIAGRGVMGTGLTGPQKWDKIIRAATNKIEGVDKKWIWFDFDAPGSKKATKMEGISGPGDSGGPAFIKKGNTLYLAGISSNQKNNGRKGVYGVKEYYTRVSAYENWIEQTVKNPDRLVKYTSKETTAQNDLQEYAGNYGFRRIILKDNALFFQREDEPLIPMRKIDKDLFLWDDENTRLQFIRNSKAAITGFEIQRRNGEVVKVVRN